MVKDSYVGSPEYARKTEEAEAQARDAEKRIRQGDTAFAIQERQKAQRQADAIAEALARKLASAKPEPAPPHPGGRPPTKRERVIREMHAMPPEDLDVMKLAVMESQFKAGPKLCRECRKAVQVARKAPKTGEN